MWIPQYRNMSTAFTLSPLCSLFPSETKTSLPLRKIPFYRTLNSPLSLCCQMLPSSQYTIAMGLDHGIINQIMWVLPSFGPKSTSDFRTHHSQKRHGSRLYLCFLYLLEVKDFSYYPDLCTKFSQQTI